MTSSELAGRIEAQVEGYAQDLVKFRGVPVDSARAESSRQYRDLLPDGVYTLNMLLLSAIADGATVGWIWLALHHGNRPGNAWMFDVGVDPPYRAERGMAGVFWRPSKPNWRVAGRSV